MTSTITVKASHGWPVRVTLKDTNTTGEIIRIVEPGKTEDFAVWDGRDIEIHEIQPNEINVD